MTSCWRFCSRFFDKPMKTLAAMVAVVLLTGLYFQQKNVIKFKESETSFRPTTTISTQQTTEKTTQNKICEISFDYGEMCPDLYTELGGFCTKKDKLYCPDIRRKIKTNLRASQLVLTRMLKIFDIIAREHNITYWITSGTLLGAARHHGFIPWDEDVDIQMPLKEYIKLFKCCKKEFPSGIFFQNSKTDPHLKPSNGQSNVTRHPLIGLYKTPWNPRLRDTLSCTRYCLENNCKWEDGLMIDMFIAEDTLTSEQRAGVFPLQKMTFEGFVFPVPNNWEEILHDFYGDYENEFGEEDSRVPQDNSDPFHSCRVLKRRIMKKRLMKEREHRKAKRRTIRGLA